MNKNRVISTIDNNERHMVLWLTGQSCAGKTMLAKALQLRLIGSLRLDGDEMRESISLRLGLSRLDREKHNLNVARLAQKLSKQVPIIVSVIAPFERTRKIIDTILDPLWIHVDRDLPVTVERPYEKPTRYMIRVNSDNQTTEEQVERIIDMLRGMGKIGPV